MTEKEMKITIPSAIITKRLKYLGINLTGCEGPIYWKLQSITQRDWERHNKMERSGSMD